MVTTVRSSMVDLATALINEAVEAERALHNDSTEHNLTDAERQRYTDYKNDRYTKAHNVLDLMRQKLPENAMPFALQIADRPHSSTSAWALPPATKLTQRRLSR